MIDYILTLGIIFIIAISLIYTNVKLKSYKNINIKKKICGFEIADKILKENDFNNVYIVEKKNSYTNTYEQNRDTLKLISNVFHEENIYAIATAIYEINNVLLIKKGNKTLKTYNNLEKILSICSKIGIISTLFGIILWKDLFLFGISIMIIIFLYQIIMVKYNEEIVQNSIEYVEKSKLFIKEEKEKIIEVIKMSNVVNIAKIGYFIVDNF